MKDSFQNRNSDLSDFVRLALDKPRAALQGLPFMFRSCTFWLLLLTLALPSAFAEVDEQVLLRAEIEELQTVLHALRGSNARIQDQLDQQTSELLLLRRERDRLSDELGECRSAVKYLQQSPGAAAAPDPVKPGPPPAPVVSIPETGFPVEYVNATHHYVTLKGGTDQGVDLNLEGRVLRDGDVIAKVNVIHVLPSQSVADIDPASLSGVYPRVGDLVLIP